MSEMIERVAAEVEAGLWSPTSGPVSWTPEKIAAMKAQARLIARAAIKAMREPTEAMTEAADGALQAWRRTLDRDEALMRSYQAHDRKFVASASPAEKHAIRYRAMIDAALAPAQVSESDASAERQLHARPHGNSGTPSNPISEGGER